MGYIFLKMYKIYNIYYKYFLNYGVVNLINSTFKQKIVFIINITNC